MIIKSSLIGVSLLTVLSDCETMNSIDCVETFKASGQLAGTYVATVQRVRV